MLLRTCFSLAFLSGWSGHQTLLLRRRSSRLTWSFIPNITSSWILTDLHIPSFSKDLQHPWRSTIALRYLLIISCACKIILWYQLPLQAPLHCLAPHRFQHCSGLQLLPPVQLDLQVDKTPRLVLVILPGDMELVSFPCILAIMLYSFITIGSWTPSLQGHNKF